MRIKDGFKFGVGFLLAKVVVCTTCDLLNKKSKLRKDVDRRIAKLKCQKIEDEPIVRRPVTTVQNRIGFTID